MKFNYLIKALPFLSTFLLIIFLNISNQKINTKLKILIWNTPSYSLGTYLSFSIGAGFIISYIINTNIAYINKNKLNNTFEYKLEEKNVENDYYTDSNYGSFQEKTLIERDINDPSPTLNAKFRVIGKTDRYNIDYIDNNIYKDYDDSDEYEEPYNEQNEKNQTYYQEKEISSDWDDDSFASW